MSEIKMDDPRYLEGCETDRQKEVLEAYLQHGSTKAAAKHLGITRRNVQIGLKRIRRNTARKYADLSQNPMSVNEGYKLKGTSTLVDSDGNTKLTWVKTTEDHETNRLLAAEAADLFAQSLPKYNPKKINLRNPNTDIIPFFNIGDAHLGMLAHAIEVGHNFDLKIAETELIEAMLELMNRNIGYERCVIQDMGDFTHYENIAGVTDHSGHALDYDTRFHKMIRIYTRVMRVLIEEALKRFQYVDVIINQGNHSRTNDIWMASFLRHVYQLEQRLTVLDNDSVFIGYRMGNTFVMSHHSDKCKHQKLVDVMATDFREDFGEAKYKYIDIGHVHHKSVAKEYGDVIIESFNQLAPADRYAHEGGWRSRSFLTCVLRSKTYGEVGRSIITSEEVKDRINKLPAGETVKHSRRKVYRV